MESTDQIASLKELRRVEGRLLSIAHAATVYCDNKKALKQIEKLFRVEQKSYKKSRYPLLDAHLETLRQNFSDLREALEKLTTAKVAEDFSRAREQLRAYVAVLREEVERGKLLLHERDELGRGTAFLRQTELAGADAAKPLPDAKKNEKN